MAIADPKIIYPKLEKDGVQKVKEKLAMGVYARYKIPLIQEWLNNQNLTAHPQFFIKEPENYKGIKYIFVKCKYLFIEFWQDQWKVVCGLVLVGIILKYLI